MIVVARRSSRPTGAAALGRETILSRVRSFSKLRIDEQFQPVAEKLDQAAGRHQINVPLTVAVASALDMGVMEWFAIAAADAGHPIDLPDDPRLDQLVTRLMSMTEPHQQLVFRVADLIDEELRGA